MRNRVLVLVTVAVLAACTEDGEGADVRPGLCISAEDGTVDLVAEDLSWFPDCLHALPDQPLTITVDNQDDGVQHNLHLTDAPGEPATELEAGPVTQELDVTLPAGDYEFVCDIHPNMVGTLRLADANPAEP